MRKYFLEISELIDRLSIVTLKSIKLGCNNPEKKKSYEEEAQLIMGDLDSVLKDFPVENPGQLIRAIQMIMLSNETIWQNEIKGSQRMEGKGYNIYSYLKPDWWGNACRHGKVTPEGKKLLRYE